MVVLLAASIVMVTVTGGLASRIGHGLGIGSAAVTAWEIAKWPVLLIIVSVMFTILYWSSPNVRHRFRWISPGSALAAGTPPDQEPFTELRDTRKLASQDVPPAPRRVSG